MEGESGDGYLTADDLRRVAGEAGHSAITPRLITDWVSIGLLDHPVPRGRGRGKGKTYTWTPEQARLFVVLLKRREIVGRRRRQLLLNIPVSMWLIWGDRYVPLRQARKAMRSWSQANSPVSMSAATRTLKETIAELNDPDATPEDRKALHELLGSIAAYGQSFGSEAILPAVRRVFDPNGNGAPSAPAGALTPETYMNVLEARLLAARSIADDVIDDATYLAAREDYLAIGPMTAFLGELLQPAAGLSAPAQAVFQHASGDACVHLLTLLGLHLCQPRPITGTIRWVDATAP